MVSSTAIPIMIDAMMRFAMSRGIEANPMMPRTATTGMRLGTIDTRPSLMPRSRKIITIVTVRKAMPKLLTRSHKSALMTMNTIRTVPVILTVAASPMNLATPLSTYAVSGA
jgi:hypothetical protein